AAIAATSPSVAAISSLAVAGMAHDGIDSVPREGTWLLDKGERVVSSALNRDLTRFLDKQDRLEQLNESGATSVTVNLIENRERAGEVERETRENGDIELNAFVA